MNHFIQRITDLYSSGDEEVKTWFMVETNYTPFILCGFYTLFSTVIGPAIMEKRKPFDLKNLMIVFNFTVVIAYTVAVSVILWNLPKISVADFCLKCMVKTGGPIYFVARSVWVIYLLKYVEFLDTVFFILRKKKNQVSFLHVVHHTMFPLLGWTFFRTEKNLFQAIPGLINSFVHIVMYTYYGLAAMGPEVRKYLWWKKYLTQLQLIQFVMIVMTATFLAPYFGCEMLITSYLIDVFAGIFFFYLFYKFYKASYLTKQESKNVNGEDTQKRK